MSVEPELEYGRRCLHLNTLLRRLLYFLCYSGSGNVLFDEHVNQTDDARRVRAFQITKYATSPMCDARLALRMGGANDCKIDAQT
jgi:hypothetical protein